MSVANNLISDAPINTMVSLAIQTHTTNDQEHMKVAVGLLESWSLTPEQNSAIVNILISVPDVENAAALMEREIEQILCPKILGLSQDPLNVIFRHLSVRDVFTCSLTCNDLKQKTQKATQNEFLWKHIYHRDFSRLNFCARPKSDSSGFFQAIKDTYQFKANLLSGIYYKKNSLERKKEFACFTVCDQDQVLYECFRDRTIGASDLRTGNFKEHLIQKSEIDSTVFFENKLYLANLYVPKEIQIYDLEKKEYLPPLKGNSIIEVPLVASDNKLCIAVKHGNIEVWELSTGALLHSLSKNGKSVAILNVDEDKLCAGYNDGSIDVWDLNEGTHLWTFQGHTSMIGFLSLTSKNLVSSCWSGMICVWDLETGQCSQNFQIHELSNFFVCGKLLYSASQNCGGTIWDLETGNCLQSFDELPGQNYPLFISDGNLYATLWDDNEVRVLDFKADHFSVFHELANLFRGNEGEVSEAMIRFSRMPQEAKKAVYKELQMILAYSLHQHPELAEDAFRGQNGQSATPEQKALAIENYIKSQTRKYTETT